MSLGEHCLSNLTVEIPFPVTFWKFPGNKFGKLGCKPLFTEEKSIAQRSMWLAYITLLVFQFISEPFHGAFPDSPVVRTLCCHCQGPGSIPAQKNKPKPSRCYQYFVTDLYLQRSEDWELAALLFFFLSQVYYGVCMIHIKKFSPFFLLVPAMRLVGS